METVKVSIALEMDADGNWCAYGDQDGSDWDGSMQSIEFSTTNPGSKRYWIEAEVPLPIDEPVTVTGEAVPA